MKNPYKRTDVFACNFGSHGKFDNRVSVYHVMQVKKCYPHGCIFFKWFCALKNKGKNCPRGFDHLGRLCEGCTQYHDEKEHYQPKIVLKAEEFEKFKAGLEDFEDWLMEVRNREVSFWCDVDSIKPLFRKEVAVDKGQIRLDGYLLIMRQGYVGSVSFDDVFYARISPHEQERLRLAPGDRFEAKGLLKLDQGRILLAKIWALNFDHRSGAETWSNTKALVAKQSATQFYRQPESCLHCPKGALVDVVEKSNGQMQMRRQLYCLEGIPDPHLCYVAAMEKLNNCAHEMSTTN